MRIEFTTSYGQFSQDDFCLVKKKIKNIEKTEIENLGFFIVKWRQEL